jgi:hypothetical protein
MVRFGKFLAAFAVSALTPLAAFAALVNGTGNVTPNVIFGTGNVNGSFTGATAGNVELALRAKLRYDLAGQPANTFNYNGVDTYTFASANSTTPINRSLFNFEWSINTVAGTLSSLTYLLTVDTDPTVNNNGAINYDPLGALSTGYYLGTNASGNGGTPFSSPGTGNLAMFNVAQNSVNMGFIGAPLGSGKFTFTLSAFNGATRVNSASMYVIVDAPAPVPLPAGGLLLIGALGGLAALRRRAKTA